MFDEEGIENSHGQGAQKGPGHEPAPIVDIEGKIDEYLTELGI